MIHSLESLLASIEPIARAPAPEKVSSTKIDVNVRSGLIVTAYSGGGLEEREFRNSWNSLLRCTVTEATRVEIVPPRVRSLSWDAKSAQHVSLPNVRTWLEQLKLQALKWENLIEECRKKEEADAAQTLTSMFQSRKGLAAIQAEQAGEKPRLVAQAELGLVKKHMEILEWFLSRAKPDDKQNCRIPVPVAAVTGRYIELYHHRTPTEAQIAALVKRAKGNRGINPDPFRALFTNAPLQAVTETTLENGKWKHRVNPMPDHEALPLIKWYDSHKARKATYMPDTIQEVWAWAELIACSNANFFTKIPFPKGLHPPRPDKATGYQRQSQKLEKALDQIRSETSTSEQKLKALIEALGVSVTPELPAPKPSPQIPEAPRKQQRQEAEGGILYKKFFLKPVSAVGYNDPTFLREANNDVIDLLDAGGDFVAIDACYNRALLSDDKVTVKRALNYYVENGMIVVLVGQKGKPPVVSWVDYETARKRARLTPADAERLAVDVAYEKKRCQSHEEEIAILQRNHAEDHAFSLTLTEKPDLLGNVGLSYEAILTPQVLDELEKDDPHAYEQALAISKRQNPAVDLEAETPEETMRRRSMIECEEMLQKCEEAVADFIDDPAKYPGTVSFPEIKLTWQFDVAPELALAALKSARSDLPRLHFKMLRADMFLGYIEECFINFRNLDHYAKEPSEDGGEKPTTEPEEPEKEPKEQVPVEEDFVPPEVIKRGGLDAFLVHPGEESLFPDTPRGVVETVVFYKGYMYHVGRHIAPKPTSSKAFAYESDIVIGGPYQTNPLLKPSSPREETKDDEVKVNLPKPTKATKTTTEKKSESESKPAAGDDKPTPDPKGEPTPKPKTVLPVGDKERKTLQTKYAEGLPGRSADSMMKWPCECQLFPCNHSKTDVRRAYLAAGYKGVAKSKRFKDEVLDWTTGKVKWPADKPDTLTKGNPANVKGIIPPKEKTPEEDMSGVPKHLQRLTLAQRDALFNALKLTKEPYPADFAKMSEVDKAKEKARRHIPRWASALASQDPAVNIPKIASGEFTSATKLPGKPVPRSQPANAETKEQGTAKSDSAPPSKTPGELWKAVKERFNGVGFFSNPKTAAEKKAKTAYLDLQKKLGEKAAKATLPTLRRRPSNLSERGTAPSRGARDGNSISMETLKGFAEILGAIFRPAR